MKKTITLSVILLQISIACLAVNPILPAGVYMADGEGHAWKDGYFYIYASRDESPNYYCSWRYDLLRTKDMTNWEIIKDIFNSKGEKDKVPYSDKLLYAPDAAYKNGKYYLYYCMDGSAVEGVAVSNKPYGPFSQGKLIENVNQIDPAIFVDDDNQAYYYWGQFSAWGAKMSDDMLTPDLKNSTKLITEKDHYFHEGASMRKRNGIYYLVYTHLRKGRATCIGYSTSKSPLGPFKYGGVIIDNAGSDPQSWNNHGSIAEFNGKWYVIYHRSSHGCRTMRKVCIEPIEFNEDGAIQEVEMTSQGASKPLDAFSDIQAEWACNLWGNVRITLESPKNEQLSGIRNEDYATYKYLDFGSGASTINITVTPKSAGTIQLLVDNLWSGSIANVKIDAANSNKPTTVSAKLNRPLSGVHAVSLMFQSDDTSKELCTIDKFSFTR